LNKWLYSFTIVFAILSIAIFSSEVGDTKGVAYDGENQNIINVAINPAQTIFTNNFAVDISPNVVSVNTGIVKFDGEGGFESKPIWVLTKIQQEDDDSFSSWVQDTIDGQNIRKDIVVTIFDRNQTPFRTYTCLDAFPLKYNYGDLDAGTSTILTETLTVKCERVQIN